MGARACRLWLLVLAALLLTCGPAAVAAPRTDVRVYALLADNSLVLSGGEREVDVAHLGLRGDTFGTGRYLAWSGPTLYVLGATPPGGAVIAVVDGPTAELRRTLAVTTEPNVFYRGISVGPRSGLLYLFGNRIRGPDRAAGPHGGPPLDAIVSVVDSQDGALLRTWTARAFDGASWFVWQGAVTADEAALYLSYHGPDTTGLDRLEIRGDALVGCGAPDGRGTACLITHGGFEVMGSSVVALGSRGADLAELAGDGAELRRFDLRLPGNHLMDLLLDTRTGTIFVPGSCGYAGGLARVELASGQVRVLVAPVASAAKEICGDRVTLARQDVLVLAHNAAAVPSPSRAGRLVFVDTTTGQEVGSRTLRSEVLDLSTPPD
jgi:hypothetical protein